jgi:hypothetical protein
MYEKRVMKMFKKGSKIKSKRRATFDQNTLYACMAVSQ